MVAQNKNYISQSPQQSGVAMWLLTNRMVGKVSHTIPKMCPYRKEIFFFFSFPTSSLNKVWCGRSLLPREQCPTWQRGNWEGTPGFQCTEDQSGSEWPHTSLRMLSGTEINISFYLGEKWNFYLLLLIFWAYNWTYTTLIQLKTSCINVREHFTQGKKQNMNKSQVW